MIPLCKTEKSALTKGKSVIGPHAATAGAAMAAAATLAAAAAAAAAAGTVGAAARDGLPCPATSPTPDAAGRSTPAGRTAAAAGAAFPVEAHFLHQEKKTSVEPAAGRPASARPGAGATVPANCGEWAAAHGSACRESQPSHTC